MMVKDFLRNVRRRFLGWQIVANGETIRELYRDREYEPRTSPVRRMLTEEIERRERQQTALLSRFKED